METSAPPEARPPDFACGDREDETDNARVSMDMRTCAPHTLFACLRAPTLLPRTTAPRRWRIRRLKAPHVNELIAFVGLAAAALTSLSYIPQVRKAWPRNSTDDLSVKTLSALSAGLALWILYGFGKGDWVIILSNFIAVFLALTVLAFKIRDIRHQ